MTTQDDSTLQDSSIPEVPAESTPGASRDTQKLAQPDPAFGWTAYAEQINGRFAMIGFVLLLILEAITGQDFFTWLGLR